jgi:hypothetical protein
VRKALQLLELKDHVDHLSGRKSKATLINEFTSAIGTDRISWQAFLEYYIALGTCVSEQTFSQMVQPMLLARLCLTVMYVRPILMRCAGLSPR